jgi:hypothetical protein
MGGYYAPFTSKIRTKLKLADETVNNSSVLQDDDELFLTVEANKSYWGSLLLRYNTGATPDIKLHFTYPISCSIRFTGYTDKDTTVVCITETGNLSLKGSSTGEFVYTIPLYIANGANAGTITLQWAQDVANATDTKVLAGSVLMLQKVN